jgi:hypothetical protein
VAFERVAEFQIDVEHGVDLMSVSSPGNRVKGSKTQGSAPLALGLVLCGKYSLPLPLSFGFCEEPTGSVRIGREVHPGEGVWHQRGAQEVDDDRLD